MLSRRPRSWATPGRGIWAGLALTPILIALAALLVASIGGGVTTATAGPAKANRVLPAKHNTATGTAARYWTSARMAAARPMIQTKQGSHRPANVSDVRTGSPGVAGGNGPAGTALGLPSGLGANAGAAPEGGSFPGPHDSFPWYPKYRRFPAYRTVKVFYTQNAVDYVASGAVTSGGTGTPQNRVWTAGHVVHDGSNTEAGWSDEILVCPVYDVGPNVAEGCWEWVSESTSPEWYENMSFSRDYGMIMLAATGTVHALNIAARTGANGFAWNLPPDQHWMVMGYPAGGGTGVCTGQAGGKIWMTAAEYAYSVSTDGDGPPANSIGSCQTAGSSGGGWMVNWHGPPPASHGGNVLINSNVSFYFTGEEGIQLQGPYFDSVTCFDWAFWTAATVTC